MTNKEGCDTRRDAATSAAANGGEYDDEEYEEFGVVGSFEVMKSRGNFRVTFFVATSAFERVVFPFEL